MQRIIFLLILISQIVLVQDIELKNIEKEEWTRTDSIDYLLLHPSIERVNWELNVLTLHSTNPDFYLHQTLGAVYKLLVIHSPISDNRTEIIILGEV